jgi:hypothetical protein
MDSFINPNFNDYSSDTTKEKNTVLKCGNFSTLNIFPGTLDGSTFMLSSITIPALKNVILEFECNIINTLFIGSINFQVFKICSNQFTSIPIGPIWTFSRTIPTSEINMFNFFVCDKDTCTCGCCTYTLVATVLGTTTDTITVTEAIPTNGTLTISNSSLTAFSAS